ncbi:MAG: hypothetical protein AAGM22_08080 [Acidobacteriota bacterium]
MTKDTKLHLFYWTITFISLIFCSVVGARYRNLLQVQQTARSGGLAGSYEAIPGDRFPAFESEDAGGVEHSVSFKSADDSSADAPHRLLLIHSPQCGVCYSQADVWRQLYTDVQNLAPDLETLSILMPGEREEEPLLDGVPTLSFPDFSFQRAYRVTGVPLTLLISPEGRLLWSHYGLLKPPKTDDVLQLIHSELGVNQDAQMGAPSPLQQGA